VIRPEGGGKLPGLLGGERPQPAYPALSRLSVRRRRHPWSTPRVTSAAPSRMCCQPKAARRRRRIPARNIAGICWTCPGLFPSYTPQQIDDMIVNYRRVYPLRNHSMTRGYDGVSEMLARLGRPQVDGHHQGTPTTRIVLRCRLAPLLRPRAGHRRLSSQPNRRPLASMKSSASIEGLPLIGRRPRHMEAAAAPA